MDLPHDDSLFHIDLFAATARDPSVCISWLLVQVMAKLPYK
jgi:hypothetical protein